MARLKECLPATLLALLLAGSTYAVYAGACDHDFLHYDDNRYVTDNDQVKAGLTIEGFKWGFTTTEMANWNPLTWLSFMLDHQLFGLDARAFHRTNVILHALNAAVLFLALRSLSGASAPSWFVAAFFALHPLHVESVAWVSERKDVLSTLFGFLSLWAYSRYARRPRLGWYLLVLITLALSLLTKPNLVTLPFVFLLLDYWPLRRCSWTVEGDATPTSWTRLLLEKLPLLLLVVGSCAMTLHAQREGHINVSRAGLPLRLEAATMAYLGYLRDTFWPTGLIPFRPYPRQLYHFEQVGIAATILLLVTVLSLARRRQCPWLLVGWLWFLGTMLPVSGIVPIVGGHCQADRYTYVPLVGVFMMFVWTSRDLAPRLHLPPLIPALVGVGLLIGCAHLTRVQISRWRDTATLWSYTLSVDPSNEVAHVGLGVLAHNQGKYDTAISHYEAALRTNPDYDLAHYNLGLVHWGRGHTEKAAEHWQRAIEIYPRYAAAHHWLGGYHWRQGNIKEAIRSYERCVEAAPDYAVGYNSLGTALLRDGRRGEAITRFEQAVAADPRYEEAHFNLAEALLAEGKAEEAAASYQAAIDLNPRRTASHTARAWALVLAGRLDDAVSAAAAVGEKEAEGRYVMGVVASLRGQKEAAVDHFRAAEQFQPRVGRYSFALGQSLRDRGETETASAWYRWGAWLDPAWMETANSLAWNLATHPESRRRNGPLAVWLARQSSEAADNKNANYLDTLAASYAEDGRFDEARLTAEKAMARLSFNREPIQTLALRGRLSLYKEKQPYRSAPGQRQ